LQISANKVTKRKRGFFTTTYTANIQYHTNIIGDFGRGFFGDKKRAKSPLGEKSEESEA
jgi:hypothetical protein